MGRMTAYELRSYPGAAADTTLNGGITSSALSFSVQSGTGSGYPDGTAGKFFVVIDYDNTSTEKILCDGRAGDAFTVDPDGRGADGTTAFNHGNGAKIRACWTATDAQESNRAAHNTVGQITTKGDLLAASGPAAMVRVPKTSDGTVLAADSSAAGGWSGKTLPSLLSGVTVDDLGLTDPALTGAVLDATSTVDGVTGAQIAADHATTAENEGVVAGLAAPLTGHLASILSGNTGPGGGGAAQTVFTIDLAAGTWVVNVTCAGGTTGSGGTGEIADLLATATTGITLNGTLRSKVVMNGANQWGSLALAFTAVVGTAGTLTVATSALSANAEILGGVGQYCGYTALKVA